MELESVYRICEQTISSADPSLVMAIEKPSRNPLPLDYGVGKRENPWQHGWRSWLMTLFSEAVAQIIIPLVIAILAIGAITLYRLLFRR